MTALRSLGLPAFLFVLAFLAFDYAQHPARYHEMFMVVKLEPMKPNPNLPTFAQVTSELRGNKPGKTEAPSPFGPNEHLFKRNRDDARRAMDASLYKPWSEYCTAEGRKGLVKSLNDYFWKRIGEDISYSNRFGTPGENYIKAEWSTPEDLRIEQRIVDLYERGYIDTKVFKPEVAVRIAFMARDTDVKQQACKG